MTKGIPRAGDGVNQRPNSVFRRMMALSDDGASRSDIRAILIEEGAKPETVNAYLKDFVRNDEDWRRRLVIEACDLHLADLHREYHSAEHRP